MFAGKSERLDRTVELIVGMLEGSADLGKGYRTAGADHVYATSFRFKLYCSEVVESDIKKS
jgi:hypothetical protein